MKDKTTITLPAELLQALDARCKEQGITRSQYFDSIVRRDLDASPEEIKARDCLARLQARAREARAGQVGVTGIPGEPIYWHHLRKRGAK